MQKMKNYERFKSFKEAVEAYKKEVEDIDFWCSDRYGEVTNWLDAEVK